ncbi:lytic transglycosylase domain-containing protein [Desulfovibrio sp. OttesenSCG-928-M16]|nr:lytic transglycosylase domain-containing protein [Desulfovibrio sp. OttesenSCG-928-M16]
MFLRHLHHLALAALIFCALPASAAEPGAPRTAYKHKNLLTRCAHAFWGLDAPVATFAAQIHAESLWRAEAKSPAGAMGMAQFMPKTADWIANLYPHLADNAPYNPAWALRALVTYDRFLWRRVSAANTCERMAKVLSAYNGGLGWLKKDEALALEKGLDPALWFDNTEGVNSGRSRAAKRENRAYPKRILLDLEPLYIRAAFGRGSCEERR